MRFNFRCIFLVVALCTCSVSSALAASVTVIPSGAGSFVIQGDGMNDVQGIDLTIGYDSSVLSAPTVRWGSLVSGAVSIANTTTIPNTIRIAIMSAVQSISGSGQIAVVNFSSQNSGCGITSLSAKIIDSKSANVPTQAGIVPGAICVKADQGAKPADGTLKDDGGSPVQGGDGSGSSGSSSPAPSADVAPASGTATAETPSKRSALLAPVPGMIAVPGQGQAPGDVHPSEPKVSPEQGAHEADQPEVPQVKPQPLEKMAEIAETAAAAPVTHAGVLDHFREYRGDKTPDALVALFMNVISPTIRQEPALAISDGKALVRLSVDLSAHKSTSPNFAFTNAKLVSLKKGADSGQWILETLPQQNTLKAGVTILNGNSVVEYPLTIVPPAAQVSGKRSDFAAFLKDSGAKKPKHDLNGDGRHDYLDDYIYTGHYLITSKTTAR